MRASLSEAMTSCGVEGVGAVVGPRETEPGYTIGTFPQAVQEEILKQYHAQYPVERPSAPGRTKSGMYFEL